MRIGCPKEIKPQEGRVGLTPAGADALVRAGHQVYIEKNAGVCSGFTDAEYLAVGAQILATPAEVYGIADMIIKVKEPLIPEYDLLREGQILFTYLHLAPDYPQTEALLRKKVTGIAYETVQLADRSLPLLAPMSEVAGRLSIQTGAHLLESNCGGRGILLGGVPGVARGKIVIIGGGVIPQGGGVVPQNVGTASQNIGAVGTPAVASVVSADAPSEPLVAPAAEAQAQQLATAAYMANTPVGGQPFEAEAQQLAQIIRVANDELLHRAQAVLSPEMEAATQTYIDKLNTLAETFAKVDEQSAKLAKDSEEMENLNRTLTGINKVYELHLKSISLQVGTIDQINEQTHKLAQQIEELNGVYGRMIQALTVNMRGGAAVAPVQDEK